jgi:hypothetical protein
MSAQNPDSRLFARRPAQATTTAGAALGWMPKRTLYACLAAASLLLATGPGHAQTACAGQPLCRELPRFTATVTDFRVSPNTQGNRPVNLTLRIHNTSEQPLVLGQVDGTAVAIDDQGQRYLLQNSRKLLGLGLVQRQRFDPKFTLGPGESADAAMELNLHVGRNQIVGTRFALQLSLREIDALPGRQFRLGREHALGWQGLGDGMGAGRETVAGGQPQQAVAAVSATPHPADPCQGQTHCTASGPLLAKVVGLQSAAPAGNNHLVTVRIAFQNLGAEALVLNYKQDTGDMLDERGQNYTVDSRYRESVQGMPVATRHSASSQFTLAPGESRTAAFIYRRYVGRVPAGTAFSPTLAVEQYRLLPSNQLKLEREYALSFTGLRAGTSVQDLGQALKNLRGLFGKD